MLFRSRLLQLGADGMDEDEIAHRMADIGAQLGGSSETDRAGLSLRTLSSARERREALDVFARILRNPSFPQEVLEREKARLIGALEEADTKPETIASVNFYRQMYRTHPYALRSRGEAATVAKLTRDDLVRFYRRHYGRRYAVVALIEIGRAHV